MLTSKQSNKGQYELFLDGASTGWTVQKNGNEWDLLSFDDEVMDTLRTKREAMNEFSAFN